MWRKKRSQKGIVPIRKSARLTKTSTPLVIKIDFSNDESYHENLEDNETLERESLENLVQLFENKS